MAQRFYEEGNSNFAVTPLTIESDGTAKYESSLTPIQGLVSIDITFDQTSEKIAADDDPNYMENRGAMTGSGTISFVGLDDDAYQALYNNVTDGNGALVFGRKGAPKKVAFRMENTRVLDDGTTSTNRFFFYNATFDLPPFGTNTKTEGETNRREFEVPVTCSLIKYKNESGEIDTVTWAGLNSKKNKEQFDETADSIYIPDSGLL